MGKTPDTGACSLSISLVHYHSDATRLAQTMHSCQEAVILAKEEGLLLKATLFFVENSEDEYVKGILLGIKHHWPGEIHVIRPGRNLGFGAGHNLAIERLLKSHDSSAFHLILNPDVILNRDAISKAIEFMLTHSQTACLTPFCVNGEGKKVYLCKQYPSVLLLAARSLFKDTKLNFLQRRLHDYEMRGLTEEVVVESVPIASGCFMFWRTQALLELRGFDTRFFLYFEDFDLSLRLDKEWRISYVPQVKITHFGGNAFQKGLRHIYLFCKSGFRFFQKHGWRWV
jgi:hypothetical protein